jgi:hypothetical protein
MRPRTRRSDVNLIPIGAGIAAITLAVECLPHSPLSSLGDGAETRIETQRAAMLVALLIWPAAAALIAQSRAWLAALLGVVTLAALWLVRDLVALGAFIAGAVVFALALWRPRSATVGVGGAIVAMIVLAPLIGWLMARYGGFLLPRAGDELVGIWRDVTFSLPSRLVQGFGFDSSGALERGVGGALLGSPRNAALQIWLELGLVGVVLAVAAAVFAASGVERFDGRARAATLGVAASAGVIMFAGSAAWQNWWMTELGLTAIALAFLSRRSRREQA